MVLTTNFHLQQYRRHRSTGRRNAHSRLSTRPNTPPTPCLQHLDRRLRRDLRAELDQRAARQRQTLQPLAQCGYLRAEWWWGAVGCW